METKEKEIVLGEIPAKRLVLASFTLLVTSFLAVFLYHIFCNQGDFNQMMKYAAYTVVMDFLIIFYINSNQGKVLKKSYSWWLISLCYLICVSLVLLPKTGFVWIEQLPGNIATYPLWLLGIAILAVLIDSNLAMVLSFGVVMITYYGNTTYEVWLIPTVLSFVICILAKYLNRFLSFVCGVLVTGSLYITLFVAQHDFSVDKLFSMENLLYYACVFVILLISYVLGSITAYRQRKEGRVEAAIATASNSEELTFDKPEVASLCRELSVAKEEQEDAFGATISIDEKECFTIEEVSNYRFPLLKLLEEESPKLFVHSKTIAYLSQKAAECVGAKQEVAFAGGLYHEIGRLLGQDYVKNGEELASQYKLPNEVCEIIRQHNFKVELPKSKEAAIVMLSDNIMSTILYLKNSGESSISPEKVIENTFSIRLNKGTLDESGISLKEFHKLKDFYISQYTT